MTTITTTMPVATTGMTIPTVIKSIALLASTDAARSILCTVRFERNDEGNLRLVATDSYKLGQLDTTIDVGEFEPFQLSVADLTNAIKVMGAKAPTYAMVIHAEHRQVEFIGHGSITLSYAEGEYPNVANLWPHPSKVVDGVAFAFAFDHMMLICKAAKTLDPKGVHPLRYVGAETNLKPQLLRTVVQDVGVLDVILMPVRVP
jgi:hypothetical protein